MERKTHWIPHTIPQNTHTLFQRKKKIEPLLQCITIIMCWFLVVPFLILFTFLSASLSLLCVCKCMFCLHVIWIIHWWCQIEQFLFSILLLFSFYLSLPMCCRFCFSLSFCFFLSLFLWKHNLHLMQIIILRIDFFDVRAMFAKTKQRKNRTEHPNKKSPILDDVRNHIILNIFHLFTSIKKYNV